MKSYGQAPSKKAAGAVAALNWNVNNRQFNVDRNNADNQNSNATCSAAPTATGATKNLWYRTTSGAKSRWLPYLNEFDRFVKHELKVKAYLRYGDDFIMIEPNKEKLEELRSRSIDFLNRILKLKMNRKNDRILKPKYGLKFLGVVLWPRGHRLSHRNGSRISHRLNLSNAGSYYGMVKHYYKQKKIKEFQWLIEQRL